MFASACSATWVPWGNAHLHMFQRLGCPILCSCDIRRFRRLDIAVRKNWESHIDASHSRQPLVKGERLVRYEVNAVIPELSSQYAWKARLSPVFLKPNASSTIMEHGDISASPIARCTSFHTTTANSMFLIRLQIMLPNNGCVAHSSVPCQCNT